MQESSDGDFIGARIFGVPNAIASIDDVRKDYLHILYKNKHWRLIELLVDSGAVDNVASPNLFPEYSIRQSEGSKKGLHYVIANNGSIPNVGSNTFVSPKDCHSRFGCSLRKSLAPSSA